MPEQNTLRDVARSAILSAIGDYMTAHQRPNPLGRFNLDDANKVTRSVDLAIERVVAVAQEPFNSHLQAQQQQIDDLKRMVEMLNASYSEKHAEQDSSAPQAN